MGDHISAATFLALLAIVAFGAVVPVLPTGASVSGAAALAGAGHPVAMATVIAAGAIGAYLGDVVTYAALRSAGEPMARRLGWSAHDEEGRIDRLRRGIERNDVRALMTGRLVPGGRIPVYFVAALTGYRWRRFATVVGAACLTWALTYALIGIGGSSVFPNTTAAVIVAVLGAVLFTGVLKHARRRLGP